MAGFDGPGAGSVLGWVQDPNSPHNLASDGNQITLASDYDILRLFIRSNTTSNTTVCLALNGDNGNYQAATRDGTIGSVLTNLQLSTDANLANGTVDITGKFTNGANVVNNVGNRQGDSIQVGDNREIASPITTIEFQDGTGAAITPDIDVEVFGRGIAR